jgi:hypothetical protein
MRNLVWSVILLGFLSANSWAISKTYFIKVNKCQVGEITVTSNQYSPKPSVYSLVKNDNLIDEKYCTGIGGVEITTNIEEDYNLVPSKADGAKKEMNGIWNVKINTSYYLNNQKDIITRTISYNPDSKEFHSYFMEEKLPATNKKYNLKIEDCIIAQALVTVNYSKPTVIITPVSEFNSTECKRIGLIAAAVNSKIYPHVTKSNAWGSEFNEDKPVVHEGAWMIVFEYKYKKSKRYRVERFMDNPLNTFGKEASPEKIESSFCKSLKVNSSDNTISEPFYEKIDASPFDVEEVE